MGAEALRYAVDPGRVAEIPQNGQAGGLPGLTQEPGFGRFIVALERLGPTHQWPPWPRTSLPRWGPSGARPVRLIWLPPGGGRPLQGVRPGSDSQVRRTNTSRPARWAGPLSVEAGLGHADLVACQGRPGAYHVPIRRTPERGGRRPPPGRGGGLSVSHQVAADAGEHRRGWISATAGANPEAGSIEGRSDVYRMAGGRKPSFKAPFSSANRPDCVRPRSEVEDHEGENGKQLASLRLLSLGLPVVWAKKVLDISGKIFDHLPMMDSVIRLFNRSYKNHFITFDNNYGRVEL